MADQLYLSLWFPNFRLASLPAALLGVLRQFAPIARDGKPNSPLGRVAAASAYPINWTESPTYQRIYVNDERAADSEDTRGSEIEAAVAEATDQLHDDTAYEFEMRWLLWQPEGFGSGDSADGDGEDGEDNEDAEDWGNGSTDLDNAEPHMGSQPNAPWRLQPTRVRITGFGPDFDSGSYEQNGHIRVDFGLDTPWTFEGAALDTRAAECIRQNVEKLLAFTLSVEKNCGISSRLLWTESGEPLAEKLVARLQRVN